MYDLIIIGAGPAGLTASIYASCYHLKHLIIGKILGGQLQYAPDILNYPGFENISGKELTERMANQVKKRGEEIIIDSVTKINQLDNHCFEAITKCNETYQTKAIILATGTERRKLNVPGETEYTGEGVYYCATCEKLDYAGKVCGVIGGANAAIQAAVELAQAASKVYIIYRGEQLRGDPIWLDQVKKNSKIEVLSNLLVTEIAGDGQKVTGVRLKCNNVTMSQRHNEVLELDKLFIEIGGVPGTALVIPLGIEMDPGGYIKIDEKLATNVAGIFAAGDLVCFGLSIEQISTAVGLGARAAASVFAYVKKEKPQTLWGRNQIKR